MDQGEVLQLMRERASGMDEHPSYQEMVNRLAELLAESRGKFSKDSFDHLVDLGAALYKAGLSQYRARGEVTALMEKSVLERKPTTF